MFVNSVVFGVFAVVIITGAVAVFSVVSIFAPVFGVFAVVIITGVVAVFSVVSIFALIIGVVAVVSVVLFIVVIVIVVVVVGDAGNLGTAAFVGPPGALTGGGEGTFVAVFVFANVLSGSEIVAFESQLRGLDGFFFIEVLLAIDELRGDLDACEKTGSFLDVDASIDDGVVDAGHGELDGGGVFRGGQLQGPISQVRLRADGVGLGVVVAKRVFLKGGGPAAESVGSDVPANHVHSRANIYLTNQPGRLIVGVASGCP